MESNGTYRKFVYSQIGIVSVTLFCGVLVYVIPHLTGHDYIFGLVPFFDVGRESSFPTYLSTVNLLVASLLCYGVYKLTKLAGESPSRSWLLLAAIFVYLSVDEAAMIHEKLGGLRFLFPDTDLIPARHSWLFAGVLLAGVLGFAMVPFLLGLPKRLAVSFIVAGLVFAGGALGMEFLGSLMLNDGASPDDFAYQIRRLVEEALEMYGIVIFNCVAAGELAKQASNFNLVTATSDH